jgi:hypothetical protein
MSDETTLTREQLHEQVWTTPMTKVAQSLGITDAKLKQLCQRYEIPTPQAGYWTQKACGTAPEPSPLERVSSPSLLVIRIQSDEELPGSKRRATLDADLAKLVKREKSPRQRIRVSEQAQNPHPIVVRTRRALEEQTSPDQYGLFRPNRQAADECAEVAVSRGSIPRAIRLIDALFRAIEERGYRVFARKKHASSDHVGNRVVCSIEGEEFGLRLREKVQKIELAEKERRQFGPTFGWKPRGIFELNILHTARVNPPSWLDDESGKLEKRLNEIMVGLFVAVQASRTDRQKTALARERERRAEETRQENERLRQAEQVRLKRIQAQFGRLEYTAECWEKARRLDAFVVAVQQEAIHRHGSLDGLDGLNRWIEWAQEYVKSIDPLVSRTTLPTMRESGEWPLVEATGDKPGDRCPKCGFKYGWDGAECRHCHFNQKSR